MDQLLYSYCERGLELMQVQERLMKRRQEMQAIKACMLADAELTAKGLPTVDRTESVSTWWRGAPQRTGRTQLSSYRTLHPHLDRTPGRGRVSGGRLGVAASRVQRFRAEG